MCSLENKDNFMMEIYPNVDYAFVVAIVAVVAAMKSPRTLKVAAVHGAELAIKFSGGAAFAVAFAKSHWFLLLTTSAIFSRYKKSATVRSTYRIKISVCLVTMTRPSDEPVLCPHVFGPQYVSGVSVNLIVNKASSEYLLMEGNDQGMTFYVLGFNIGVRNLLMLQGPEKAPVAVLAAEGHAEWNAYSCDKSEADSVKIFSVSKDGAQVNVSLAKKLSSGDDMHFQIKGSWSDRNCAIYMGDSSTIIAQMHPLENKDKVMVEIYPNVDYAFVVALIVIVDAMKIDEPVVCPPVMAQPTDESPVIGRQYIFEESVNLMFKKVEHDEYDVFKDSSTERVFNLKSCHTTFPKWMLVGANENPVAMLHKKKATAHNRWYAIFFSEIEADPKWLFSVCKDQMVQRQTELNVIFEKERDVAIDYKVKGSWTDKACTIYKGDSLTKIAQMRSLEDKDNFMVEIYPNVDYAFVAAIVAVVAAMKSPRTLKFVAVHGADLAVKFAGGAAFAAGKFLTDTLF
ncbi:hypothetical protein L1987_85881 [Smallanthus sonchifolius]|uniref:Uncharacterized protein n=1 Tax=Smallanthus sonchifolius TaxID=185202 RepID=A0ACB8XXY4_9ASTR|nr:hypothetical protein L1987_85881 [Smallanthus sonchifolius]